MGEFRCESLVPPEPLPWRAAAPAWRARLQNQPLTLSVPLYRPHLHEPIIFATLVPSKHFSSPALLQFRSLIPRANWPPEYSQPKTIEFSNYRFVPLRVEQHTVCSAGHAGHTLPSTRIVVAHEWRYPLAVRFRILNARRLRSRLFPRLQSCACNYGGKIAPNLS